MNNLDTQPKGKNKEEEEQKKNSDDAVLPQIGEDPGLPADAIEQDSKSMTSRENKQGKDTDTTTTKG